MRRWMLSLLLFALAFWIDTSRAAAQPKRNPPVDEWVETADGMKLHAQFTATTTPKKGETIASSPVVLLLYPPGVGQDMNKGHWGDLITMLNADGFHVFQFDWRGHGKSTNIVNPKEFWTSRFSGPWNQKLIKGGNKKLMKVVLTVDETDPKYFPMYVQDLAAIRVHLDQKSDKKVINTSSIYVVGAEDTVQLGFLWLTAEWNRPGIHPMLPGGAMYEFVPTPTIAKKPEGGKDIAGLIWLTAKVPGKGFITPNLLQAWVKNTPGIQESNPMLFLYGDGDSAEKTAATFYFKEILAVRAGFGAGPLQQTFIREVKGTKMRGTGLLGQNAELKTEDTILAYLKQLEKERGPLPAKNRNFVTPYFIDLVAIGLNI